MAADLRSRTKVVSRAWRYGLAAVSCGIALAIALPTDAPSSCFFIAVVLSGLYGGKGPGILAVALSTLGFDYFFLPPRFHFIVEPSSFPRLAAFLGANILIAGLIEAKRRESRQAEAALRKSESYLAEAEKLSHAGSWAWDVNRRETVYWSAEMYLLYKRDPSQRILSRHEISQFHDPEDWAHLMGKAERAAREKLTLDHTSRLTFPDGSYKRVRYVGHPAVNAKGEVFELFGTAMDITEQFEAEARLRLIIDTIPALAWSTRLDGSVDFFNQRWLDYTGLAAEQELGWGWKQAIHTDDVSSLMDYWQSVLASGEAGEMEARLRRFDGEYRWFLFRVSPLCDEAGNAVKWYGTNTDIEDRKRAEESLRASELNLRLMVDSIPALVSTMTASGDAELVNRQVMDYTGRTLEEMKDWLPTIHPEDRTNTANFWRRAVETGNPYDVEERIQRADGVYRWFHARGLPLRDAEGTIVRWYVILTDIEDRRRAEDALRASELNFRQIVDSIPGLLCTNTSAGEVELVNQTLLNYTGKRLEELRDWHAVVHPGDLPGVASLWGHSVRTGHPFNVDVRVCRADGTYRWFHCRGLPSRDADGRIVRWYNLLTDIEDRTNAEAALRASEQELGLIVEMIPGLVWCASPRGELTYVNRRVLNYIGTNVETLAQDGWTNFLDPDDLEGWVGSWSHAVATGGQHEVQYRLRRWDGEYRWFQVLGQPLRDGEGRVIRWYGLLIDIDDRKNVEEALRSAQNRLARATQTATVGELAASIAHEINQPLAAVVANGHACLRWLSADPPSLARAYEAGERIVRDGKEAGEVVRRIRALFRRASLEKATLDLNEVIGEVLGLLGSETRKRRVAVETDLETALPAVVADRVQLQQLVLNLLINGLDAMDPVQDRPRKLYIRSKRECADTVLVEMRDYGVGLKDPEKVFEAFFTTKENGMGMGLTICRSIIEAHNGRLWASSAEGPGTKFCFTLPVKSSAAA